jgi:GNAT superfamily N-acetyltransferase
MIRLRATPRADVPHCVPLLGQLGCEPTQDEAARRFAAVPTAQDHLLLVAETGARVVGLLHAFARPALENPREAVVQAIVVDERSRGRGVGRALMAAAERWGTERCCHGVALSSTVARAPARAFYRTLGYRVSAASYVLRKDLSG